MAAAQPHFAGVSRRASAHSSQRMDASAGLRLYQYRVVHAEPFGTALQPAKDEQDASEGAEPVESKPKLVTCFVEERSVQVPGSASILSMSSTSTEAFAVTDKGSVLKVWERGFKVLPFRTQIVAVACGLEHVAFLSKIGAVWTLGQDRGTGALGLETRDSTSVPVLARPVAGKKVSAIAAGPRCVAAIANKEGGSSVVFWGRGDSGKPVLREWGPERFMRGDPLRGVAVGESHIAVCSSLGQVYWWGTHDPIRNRDEGASDTPVHVAGPLAGHSVVQVQARRALSLALTESGQVYAWGRVRGVTGVRSERAASSARLALAGARTADLGDRLVGSSLADDTQWGGPVPQDGPVEGISWIEASLLREDRFVSWKHPVKLGSNASWRYILPSRWTDDPADPLDALGVSDDGVDRLPEAGSDSTMPANWRLQWLPVTAIRSKIVDPTQAADPFSKAVAPAAGEEMDPWVSPGLTDDVLGITKSHRVGVILQVDGRFLGGRTLASAARLSKDEVLPGEFSPEARVPWPVQREMALARKDDEESLASAPVLAPAASAISRFTSDGSMSEDVAAARSQGPRSVPLSTSLARLWVQHATTSRRFALLVGLADPRLAPLEPPSRSTTSRVGEPSVSLPDSSDGSASLTDPSLDSPDLDPRRASRTVSDLDELASQLDPVGRGTSADSTSLSQASSLDADTFIHALPQSGPRALRDTSTMASSLTPAGSAAVACRGGRQPLFTVPGTGPDWRPHSPLAVSESTGLSDRRSERRARLFADTQDGAGQYPDVADFALARAHVEAGAQGEIRRAVGALWRSSKQGCVDIARSTPLGSITADAHVGVPGKSGAHVVGWAEEGPDMALVCTLPGTVLSVLVHRVLVAARSGPILRRLSKAVTLRPVRVPTSVEAVASCLQAFCDAEEHEALSETRARLASASVEERDTASLRGRTVPEMLTVLPAETLRSATQAAERARQDASAQERGASTTASASASSSAAATASEDAGLRALAARSETSAPLPAADPLPSFLALDLTRQLCGALDSAAIVLGSEFVELARNRRAAVMRSILAALGKFLYSDSLPSHVFAPASLADEAGLDAESLWRHASLVSASLAPLALDLGLPRMRTLTLRALSVLQSSAPQGIEPTVDAQCVLDQWLADLEDGAGLDDPDDRQGPGSLRAALAVILAAAQLRQRQADLRRAFSQHIVASMSLRAAHAMAPVLFASWLEFWNSGRIEPHVLAPPAVRDRSMSGTSDGGLRSVSPVEPTPPVAPFPSDSPAGLAVAQISGKFRDAELVLTHVVKGSSMADELPDGVTPAPEIVANGLRKTWTARLAHAHRATLQAASAKSVRASENQAGQVTVAGDLRAELMVLDEVVKKNLGWWERWLGDTEPTEHADASAPVALGSASVDGGALALGLARLCAEAYGEGPSWRQRVFDAALAAGVETEPEGAELGGVASSLGDAGTPSSGAVVIKSPSKPKRNKNTSRKARMRQAMDRARLADEEAQRRRRHRAQAIARALEVLRGDVRVEAVDGRGWALHAFVMRARSAELASTVPESRVATIAPGALVCVDEGEVERATSAEAASSEANAGALWWRPPIGLQQAIDDMASRASGEDGAAALGAATVVEEVASLRRRESVDECSDDGFGDEEDGLALRGPALHLEESAPEGDPIGEDLVHARSVWHVLEASAESDDDALLSSALVTGRAQVFGSVSTAHGRRLALPCLRLQGSLIQDGVARLLSHVYTGSCVVTPSTVLPLAAAARSYGLPLLLARCELNLMERCTDIATATDLLEASSELGLARLRGFALITKASCARTLAASGPSAAPTGGAFGTRITSGPSALQASATAVAPEEDEGAPHAFSTPTLARAQSTPGSSFRGWSTGGSSTGGAMSLADRIRLEQESEVLRERQRQSATWIASQGAAWAASVSPFGGSASATTPARATVAPVVPAAAGVAGPEDDSDIDSADDSSDNDFV
jgi:hypothetical protein